MGGRFLRDMMSELTNEQILLIAKSHFKIDHDQSERTINAYCDSVRAVITSYGLAEPSKSPLSDLDIDAIAESMPGGINGFLKGWGWRNFARAVEAKVLLAVPDGWKLVPTEPTVSMWVDGFEAVSEFHDTPEYAEMAGCKGAAESAKVCYRAMLAAAPTGDDK